MNRRAMAGGRARHTRVNRPMLQSTFHRHSAPLFLATLVFLIAGCARDRAPGEEDGSTVSFMMPLDRYALSWHWSSQAQFLVFSPLVARNAEGELEPRLAASWEHSPDYREWTVRLNTEARWHDGVPVTAADVKFTLDLLAHTAGPGRAPYAVTVLDDSTYHIRYERPGIGSPLDDFTVIYPEHHLEELDTANWAEWDFWTAPIGSGPFRHVRTVPGYGFEFEANPDYFRGRPRIDHVVLHFGAQQLQQLLSGEVDVLPSSNEMQRLRLQDDARFRAYQWYNPTRMKVVLWNHRSPVFEDAAVRRALTLAVDRRELRRVAGLPDDLPTFDAMYSERQFRIGEVPEALPFDPVEAARLLDAAGWQDSDGDGVRDRSGVPFRFRLLFGGGGGGSWTAQGSEAIGLLVQNALQPLGIEVELQPIEESVARERLLAGEFDAAVTDVAGLPLRIETFGEGNLLGYENSRVAALLERIRTAFDPDSVDHFYRELAAIFTEDHPALFLFPAITTTIAHRRIGGMSTPYRGDALWYLEDLWIEDGGEQRARRDPAGGTE